MGFVRSALRPGDCCLDIGSHKGAYAYWMAERVGRGGLVVAFEPQPGYASMQRRLWERSGKQHVRVEELALSDAAGEATLWIPSWGPSPGASLVRSSLGEGATEVRVPMLSLDAYAAQKQLPRVALIKCDVEGHELSVFRGGEQVLRRDKPALLFECEARFGGEDRVRSVFAYLRSIGYRGWFVHRGRKVASEDFRAAVHQSPELKRTCNNFVFEPCEWPEGTPKVLLSRGTHPAPVLQDDRVDGAPHPGRPPAGRDPAGAVGDAQKAGA